jgi:glutamate racemase
MASKNQPIGIFDSGIGGLTVASAISKLLPNEQLLYFGDTAHLPYGEKSTAAIQAYSIKICNFLVAQNCKLILIACNSASAAAYELVKEYIGDKIKIVNVIDPVVGYVGEHFAAKKVGLIGTKQTINSGVYKRKIDELSLNIELKSLATPLLASMIEEGFFNNSISKSVINQYLSDATISDIESLILGCTHYPLIKNEINEFYNGSVTTIDSSEIVAKYLKSYLEMMLLANENREQEDRFYVSDYTQSFEAATQLFFNKKVRLELVNL